MEQLVNPVSLKDQAYNAIKEAILSLQLKPGSPLVEADLARQLGVSKTPVRDALFELEKEGLVEKILFKGTYVTQLKHSDLVHIFEVRAVLEGLAARISATTLSEEDLSFAEETLKAQCDAIKQDDFNQANQMNTRFHQLIIARCSNELLKPILANLEDKLRRYRILSAYQAGRQVKSCQEHQEVLKALKARDAGLAEKLLRAHLRSVAEDMIHQDIFRVGEDTFELADKITR